MRIVPGPAGRWPPDSRIAISAATTVAPATQSCGGSRGTRSRRPAATEVRLSVLASGKRRASSVACSARCRRPRFSQSGPYPATASSSSSAANCRAEAYLPAGSLASPA
ncbi:hypothetical protein ACFQ0B_73170 [Nonomuraea thailandensis]